MQTHDRESPAAGSVATHQLHAKPAQRPSQADGEVFQPSVVGIVEGKTEGGPGRRGRTVAELRTGALDQSFREPVAAFPWMRYQHGDGRNTFTSSGRRQQGGVVTDAEHDVCARDCHAGEVVPYQLELVHGWLPRPAGCGSYSEAR